MKYKKTLKVKSPERGTPQSAGIDFFIPEFTDNFIKKFLDKNEHLSMRLDSKTVRLGPHEGVNIPSGIKVEIPPGHALIAFNKSGIATRYKLYVGAQVIDEDYQGEIHIHLTNVSPHWIDIYAGQKIIQFILTPVNYATPIEDESIHSTQTERGEGGFGSTGM